MWQISRQNWVSGTGTVKMVEWSGAKLSSTVGWFVLKEAIPAKPLRSDDSQSI